MEEARPENQGAELLRAEAEAYRRQGQAFGQAGQPAMAEQQLLRALKVREQLLADSGAQTDAAAARELCLSLADLCMQQGNMHGADFYYVRAMAWGQRFPDAAEKK